MILFVFEGQKAEPMVFRSLEQLFFSGEEVRMVKCSYDLPTLYKRLKDNGYDLFRSLPLSENGIEVPEEARLTSYPERTHGRPIKRMSASTPYSKLKTQNMCLPMTRWLY